MLNFQQNRWKMKKYLKILKRCPLFFGIGEEKLLTMLTCLGAKIEFFDKKYTVISEGSPAKYIGIMLSGTAQIIKIDYFGNRSIISNITAGETFGEAFACAELKETPITVIANEPCEIMLIDSNHILHTCSNNCGFHQQLIFNIMKELATKTIVFHQKLEVISKRSTREKLMTYLLIRAKQEDSNSFDIPFDRQELADYLEVDRSGLSAELGKLRKEGILSYRKNHFELLK